MRAIALALLLPTLALGQSSAPRPEDLGTVTGHITCADTQRPARLAEVRLIPANIGPSKDSKPGGNDDFNAFGGNIPAVQTDLSGGYTIANVKPGPYYVRVDLVGYVTPLLDFTREELAKPSPETQQRIQNDLQRITVAPQAAVTADVTLRRGAAIAGTVTFDDGSPAIGVGIRILRRNAKGEFKEQVQSNAQRWFTSADDHGRYRFDALPEGEYAVEADLTLSSQTPTTIPMGNGQTMEVVMTKYLFSLPVFSGNVIRRKDASPVKLDAGQETSGIDITIPVSQLHDISGSIQAKDGHTINGGKVALLFADDRSQFAIVDIDSDDGTFHFPYVPEGNYILSAEEAKDVGHVEVPNPPGSKPPTHTEHPTLHTYGTAEQPLTVTTDLQSVSLIVPEKPSTTASE
jgi:protocatechuate 3,4-dioxygenase beta subunit